MIYHQVLRKSLIPIVLLLLISIILCSCANTPVDLADAYINELNDDPDSDCVYSASLRESGGSTIYEVWVDLPFTSYEFSKITEKVLIETIGLDVYYDLEQILADDDSIDMIVLFF